MLCLVQHQYLYKVSYLCSYRLIIHCLDTVNIIIVAVVVAVAVLTAFLVYYAKKKISEYIILILLHYFFKEKKQNIQAKNKVSVYACVFLDRVYHDLNIYHDQYHVSIA